MPQNDVSVRCANENCNQEYGMAVFFCARCGEPLVSKVRVEAGGLVIAIEFRDGKQLFLTPIVREKPVPVLEVQFEALQNRVKIRTQDGDFDKSAREMFDALQQGQSWKLE